MILFTGKNAEILGSTTTQAMITVPGDTGEKSPGNCPANARNRPGTVKVPYHHVGTATWNPPPLALFDNKKNSQQASIKSITVVNKQQHYYPSPPQHHTTPSSVATIYQASNKKATKRTREEAEACSSSNSNSIRSSSVEFFPLVVYISVKRYHRSILLCLATTVPYILFTKLHLTSKRK